MNQESKLIAAIDIGTTKVVAVAGRKYPDGHIQVLGVEKAQSTGVKRGVVLNIDETVSAIKQAVSALEARFDIRIAEVFVGMAGYSMKSLTNRCYRFIDPNDEISTFDLEQLLRDSHRISLDPGEKIIHVIPQDYSVDNEQGEKNPVGMSGQRLEGNFHVVIGRMASVKNIEKCVHRAGLQLNGVVLEPLASAHAVLTEEEMEAGVVMIDIGGGTTDFALFYDGIIRHTAVIPFGGNVVTNDIKEGCSVLFKQAETLKVQFGSAMGSMAREDMVVAIPGMPGWESKEISFKNLSSIIQARMEEIIEYVAHHIDTSGYYDKLGAGIVITGGGALLKNIAHLIRLKTGLDVRMGQPDRYMNEDLVNEGEMPLYSTSVGLLVSSSMYATQRVVEQKLFESPEEEQPVRAEAASRKVVSKQKTGRSRMAKEASHITGDLFGSLKNRIAGIFDDKDVEM
ncbi:cell division protein FtsA [Geofilum rubicundum]|uniref:Cell division protein FtsA n=1 Tax=Geofilum rubicundum JCM 15548 TaxID=1236989 RepID=A0A0E9M0C1_9BACT|nr:cell division protein FtsA [Geofilum rubicundum]GAO30988.1 cell division protein FtsA [Geofilum rubicundum JCM 15548]